MCLDLAIGITTSEVRPRCPITSSRQTDKQRFETRTNETQVSGGKELVVGPEREGDCVWRWCTAENGRK